MCVDSTIHAAGAVSIINRSAEIVFSLHNIGFKRFDTQPLVWHSSDNNETDYSLQHFIVIFTLEIHH
jgi:hypothetical protein